MRKSIFIGVITGVVVFLLVISCGQRTQTASNNGNNADVAQKNQDGTDKNKTEGYFYHQPEQGTGSDSTKIRKKVDN